MTIFHNYQAKQNAIKFIKEHFSSLLAQNLNLIEVCAPLLVKCGDGTQDNLNGIEKPVTVAIKEIPGDTFEVVHSLAKWKRSILGEHRFAINSGIYTHMLALRPDEEKLDALHSVCVDQWDWEMVIAPKERNLDMLKAVVQKVYQCIKITHDEAAKRFTIPQFLPSTITFIHAEDLVSAFPDKTPKEREQAICQKHLAVFLLGIGGKLPDGKPHDGRAPDYDDWTTPTSEKHCGLNGDILVWHPKLQCVCELSSMGIRVNQETLLKQIKIRNCEERLDCEWHQKLLRGELPQTIGGGIGRSRLTMLLLQQEHIAYVQESVWARSE